MGLIAGIGGIVGGIGGSLMSYFTSPSSTPTYDYKATERQLGTWMNRSLDTYSDIDSVTAGQASYNYVDPTKTGQQSVNFNLQNQSNYDWMASSSNQNALKDKLGALNAIAPQWQNQQEIADKTNMALMKGEIPMDVQQQLARTNAYKSLQGGYSGSDSARQGTLARDLGLTSLGLTSLGQTQADNWLKTMNEIAMPDQVSSKDIMDSIGFNADLTTRTALENERVATDTQLKNAGLKLDADKFNVESQFAIADATQNVWDTELAVRTQLESQKLADKTGQFQYSNERNSNLWGGIGNSLSSGLGGLSSNLFKY